MKFQNTCATQEGIKASHCYAMVRGKTHWFMQKYGANVRPCGVYFEGIILRVYILLNIKPYFINSHAFIFDDCNGATC